MKTLYLDIFSGISGDMFIGAMLDLGLELDHLEHELEKLHLEGYHLHASRVRQLQIEGVKFDVDLGHSHRGHGHEHEHAHEPGQDHRHEEARSFAEIRQLIEQSHLSAWVKEKSIAVFRRIAVAEAKIHGLAVDSVHFHEVGAVDSIIDIAGACVALEFFGRPRVLAGGVVDGNGWIDCAHGRLPVPAPATLEILAARGVPIAQCEEPNELITPTGPALLAEFVEKFGLMDNFVPARIGLGVGGRQNKTRPNVLRAILGESPVAAGHDWETDTVAVLETNLDDVSPELLGHFTDLALAEGALDVSLSPAQMKKNRPGVLLTLLCATEDADKFSALILRHTSAFGVRRSLWERRKLRREFQTVPTVFGDVILKIGRLDGAVVQTAPEYESCRKRAAEKNVPLKAVYDAALAAAKGGQAA
jgi:uncharacterized protein (TIGR00299 family) protein